jgi:AcrR family transcriptional regulator/DNA-binding MarR family transcriptional regulator
MTTVLEQPPARLARDTERLFPRGHVTSIQRERMLAAAAEAVAARGYAELTVTRVIARARVSRKTFYAVFADREDCFLAVLRREVDRAAVVAREAYAREGCWRDGVRAALARLLALMDAERGLARLCIVESPGAGPRVLAYRAGVLEQLAAVIDRGREAGGRGAPSELTAEGLVGGVFAVVHARLLADRDEPLQSLLGSLMSMIVLPYLGARAAHAELTGGAHEIRRQSAMPAVRRREDPLAGLKLRLTYRTLTVLGVIRERPGASNREIAERAGILDQGQISKLLARLARLGLLTNRGPGQRRGAANAWHLTARGGEVESATRIRQ